MYEIVIGRSDKDKEKYGLSGTIFLGKHFVKMGRTSSLANKIYMDMIRSHVVFICGKRGSGKSYTMGVIAEGMADLPKEIKQNISIIMLDTMGIYWTMKYPNKKDQKLLTEWELESKGLDVQIYTPTGYFKTYKDKGIPTDHPFSIKPSELDADDWNMTFEVSPHEPIGVLIERIIYNFKDKEIDYDIDDIIKAIAKDQDADNTIKGAAKNLFMNAKKLGGL